MTRYWHQNNVDQFKIAQIQGENKQTQGKENSGVSTVGKEKLIELQEKDTTLSHIQEQVVSDQKLVAIKWLTTRGLEY